MLMSEGLTELKYQELLEYPDVVTDAAVYSVVTNTSSAEISCLFMAVLTSVVMGCCALVFMPGPRHDNQR